MGYRLQSQGLGVMGGTIMVGSGADIPNTTRDGPAIITIISTGGRERIRIQDGGSLRQPAFQVTARHKRFEMAEVMAYAAMAALDFSNLQLEDLFFLWSSPQQEPFDLGKDGVGNLRSVFNVQTCLRSAVPNDADGIVTPGGLPVTIERYNAEGGKIGYRVVVKDGAETRVIHSAEFNQE